ncbi:aspartate-semialdehyde dehydrogenase, partial [Candidatus Bathyarchaeota archaeon]|nr:aspartate-semialdehyde dehydrogenase [Candidatus Bathyarchaeota archaeon]
MKKIGVAIAGATGAIGQQFIRFVDKNPQFNIECLTASDNSVGKKYSEQAIWYAEFGVDMPETVKDMIITKNSVQEIKKTGDIDIVFSALPTEEAELLEPKFAQEGMVVVTKSSPFRMDECVPLLIPEVNPEHLAIIEHQKKVKNWKGAIVADPNCTTTGFAMTLKPIYDNFGIKNVFVVTMQATSGA